MCIVCVCVCVCVLCVCLMCVCVHNVCVRVQDQDGLRLPPPEEQPGAGAPRPLLPGHHVQRAAAGAHTQPHPLPAAGAWTGGLERLCRKSVRVCMC